MEKTIKTIDKGRPGQVGPNFKNLIKLRPEIAKTNSPSRESKTLKMKSKEGEVVRTKTKKVTESEEREARWQNLNKIVVI